MQNTLIAKDLMIDVFEFPHLPYWFTIRQAIEIVKKSLIETDKCHHPLVALVFDEKYNLLGTAGYTELLKGLEPVIASQSDPTQGTTDNNENWTDLFSTSAKKEAEKPVSEVMIPAQTFAKTDDPVAKAAHIMINRNIPLLPVVDNTGKLVGLLRVTELFNEITNSLFKK